MFPVSLYIECGYSLEKFSRTWGKRIVSKRRGLFVYYSKTMDDKRHSRSMRRDRIGRFAIGWEALVSLWRTSVNSTTAIESETARPKWYCSEIIVSSKAPRIPIPWCHEIHPRDLLFSYPFSTSVKRTIVAHRYSNHLCDPLLSWNRDKAFVSRD